MDVECQCVRFDLLRKNPFERSNGSVGEVVEDGVNGVIFDSSDDLYQQLMVFSGLYYIDRRI
jgi:hypothetical protein